MPSLTPSPPQVLEKLEKAEAAGSINVSAMFSSLATNTPKGKHPTGAPPSSSKAVAAPPPPPCRQEVVLRILSAHGSGPEVGLTEVELFDDKVRRTQGRETLGHKERLAPQRQRTASCGAGRSPRLRRRQPGTLSRLSLEWRRAPGLFAVIMRAMHRILLRTTTERIYTPSVQSSVDIPVTASTATGAADTATLVWVQCCKRCSVQYPEQYPCDGLRHLYIPP